MITGTGGEINVVESDDGDVFRHTKSQIARRIDHPERQGIVHAKNAVGPIGTSEKFEPDGIAVVVIDRSTRLRRQVHAVTAQGLDQTIQAFVIEKSTVAAPGKASLDSDAALQALELYLSLKPYAPKGVETYNSSEVRDALMQGTTAMTIELWPSWAPSLDDPAKSKVSGQIEIMAAPGQTQGPAPMLGSWLLAVPADAPNADRGRDFIDFITSADVQKKLALETGTPPTRASVYTDADVVKAYRWYPAQLEALKNAQPRPRITQWSKVENILGDYLQLALIGEMQPKEALAEANEQIARALSR